MLVVALDDHIEVLAVDQALELDDVGWLATVHGDQSVTHEKAGPSSRRKGRDRGDNGPRHPASLTAPHWSPVGTRDTSIDRKYHPSIDDETIHPALARILRSPEAAAAIDHVSCELSGADFATFMLEVARRRSAAVTPSELLHRFGTDRFVRPATSDVLHLRRVELAALEAAALAGFDLVGSSPLAPLGTSSLISGISQNRVVATSRASEVNADPTTYLALEAARRRRELLYESPRSAQRVRLASADRVVRAQKTDDARSFAHFSLFGMVSAGRDEGSSEFERTELVSHIRLLVSICRTLGVGDLEVSVTSFTPERDVITRVLDGVAENGVDVREWPERIAGRGYYPTVCFKLHARINGETVEIADGGPVTWTQALLDNRKERLVISGLGIERLAMIDGAAPTRRP